MDRARVGSPPLSYSGTNSPLALNSVIETCSLEVVSYMCLIFLKKNHVPCTVKSYRFCDTTVVRNKVIV